MAKVVLGLSGGVDSAVSARLLMEKGYEVSGLFLDIGNESSRRDAVDAAGALGIELKVLDVSRELEKNVCSPFAQSYLRGETPNPCVLCNPTVKFASLAARADELGAEFIATGHYARAQGGAIYKGMPSNDQSYMLCRVKREQAARLILPLGGYEKCETRAIAERFGMAVAHKPDSMEICFIPDKDYVGWLSRRGELPPGGSFIYRGEVLGHHEGIYRWTVGQRIPGLYDGRKLYVSEIRPAENEIVVVPWEELFTRSVEVRDMNWLIDEPSGPIRASVKVRHTKWECPQCTAVPLGGGRVSIQADSDLRAPARGQAAALYDGDRLLGGGFIM